MKRLFFLILLFFAVQQTMACEIKFEIPDSCKQEVYKPGDVVILSVEVQFSHRSCDHGVQLTKFSYENLKVLGATAWKEEKPGYYTRMVKIQITDDKKGDALFSAERKCDKDGGYGVCKLKKT